MVRIPPPVWALAYLIFGLLISDLVGSGQGLKFVPLGIVLVVAGAGLSVLAASLFHSEGTELNPTSPTNQRLVTSGPFRLTRNPMYLGLILLTLGIAFWIGTWPMFFVPPALFATLNWAHIPYEEAKMRRQFGAAFEVYEGKVRRWI
jgi:protein-S-isoprenylcysteine O-methyltransferase Ste14